MANNSLIAAFGRMWQQIKSLIDDNNEVIDGKISNVNLALDRDVTNLNDHVNNYTMHITSEERSKWNTIENTINTTEIDLLFEDKIVFYMNSTNTSYEANAGMTWEDWINSPFNTDGYYTFNDRVFNSVGKDIYTPDGNVRIKVTDLILAGAVYTTVANVGGGE